MGRIEAVTVGLALAVVVTLPACGSDDGSGASATPSPRADVATIAPAPNEAVTTTPVATASVDTNPSQPGADSEAPTADEVLATLTDDDIAEVGGIECATELAMIIAAGERYIADTGVEPESLDVLSEGDYLTDELALWRLNADSLQPVEGSGCIDVFGATIDCREESGRLTIARLAYVSAHPGAQEATQLDLVNAGYIIEQSAQVDLVGGEVVAVEGGPCEGVELAVDWPHECAAAVRTLEVAAEAYYAQTGAYPTSEDFVVPEYIRFASPMFDIVDGDVVAEPGGPCDGVAPPEATPEQCGPTRTMLEVAVDAYYAQTGKYPESEDELVGDFLREPSTEFDVVDGAVVAVAGGACEGI